MEWAATWPRNFPWPNKPSTRPTKLWATSFRNAVSKYRKSASNSLDHAACHSDCVHRFLASTRCQRCQSEIRRRTQPRRVLRSRRSGNNFICRRRARRGQSRTLHAGSRPRRCWRDGRDPRNGFRKCHRSLQRRSRWGSVPAANINSPEQVVISGNKEAVERAARLASERGAKRAVMLPVSAPFHCALMQPAQDRLAGDLNSVRFRDPNGSRLQRGRGSVERWRSRARRPGSPSHRLSKVGTIHAPVDSAGGAGVFVENTGKVLCGLMRQIDRGPKCANVGDEPSLHKTTEFLTASS